MILVHQLKPATEFGASPCKTFCRQMTNQSFQDGAPSGYMPTRFCQLQNISHLTETISTNWQRLLSKRNQLETGLMQIKFTLVFP